VLRRPRNGDGFTDVSGVTVETKKEEANVCVTTFHKNLIMSFFYIVIENYAFISIECIRTRLDSNRVTERVLLF
jgi:hypothetical protein